MVGSSDSPPSALSKRFLVRGTHASTRYGNDGHRVSYHAPRAGGARPPSASALGLGLGAHWHLDNQNHGPARALAYSAARPARAGQQDLPLRATPHPGRLRNVICGGTRRRVLSLPGLRRVRRCSLAAAAPRCATAAATIVPDRSSDAVHPVARPG